MKWACPLEEVERRDWSGRCGRVGFAQLDWSDSRSPEVGDPKRDASTLPAGRKEAERASCLFTRSGRGSVHTSPSVEDRDNGPGLIRIIYLLTTTV